MRRAVLAVANRSYALDSETSEWARDIGRVLLEHVELPHGVLAQVYDCDTGHLILRDLVDASPLNSAIASSFSGTEPVRRLISESGVRSVTEQIDGSWLDTILSKLSPGFAPKDCVGIVARDDVSAAAVMAFPVGERGLIPPDLRALGDAAWPHIAAGLRLRRSVSGLQDDSPAIEARFDSDGACIDARGAARPGAQRERLRSAVRAIERAKLRNANDDDALSLDAIVAGRWSLVERFDNDDSRYFVAYRNPPGLGDLRRLSDSEREVAQLAACGMSNKEIGAAVGVSTSMAATVLGVALRKLRLESVLSLPVFWRLGGSVNSLMGSCAELAFLQSPLPSLPASVTLSATEDEVLRALLAGASNQEIADIRGTSSRTIANQVASIFRKSGARSRRELAALASRAGAN